MPGKACRGGRAHRRERYPRQQVPRVVAVAERFTSGRVVCPRLERQAAHVEQEWTMNLIVILIILILLFGGGGFYAGAPYHFYGGGLSLVLVVVLIVLLLRR
jgi:hypothetical protein